MEEIIGAVFLVGRGETGKLIQQIGISGRQILTKYCGSSSLCYLSEITDFIFREGIRWGLRQKDQFKQKKTNTKVQSSVSLPSLKKLKNRKKENIQRYISYRSAKIPVEVSSRSGGRGKISAVTCNCKGAELC